MKKFFIVLAGVVFLAACGNTTGEGGATDDGIGTMDTDGALVDSTRGMPYNPSTDTSNMEDRVDLQQRQKVDTSQLKSDSGQPAHAPVQH